MGTTPESKFQAKVKKRLDALIANGYPLYYFVKEAASIRGIPDLVLCVAGKFVTWEVKPDKSELNRTGGRIVLQRYVGTRISKAQGVFRFVHPDNLEECLKEIEGILESSSV